MTEPDVDLDEVDKINDFIKRSATSTSYRYATLMVNYMWDNSKLVPAEDLAIYGYPGNHGEQVRIYEGTIQGAGVAVGLAKSAGTIAYGLLAAMQCVTTLRRATPNRPSIVLLSYKPSEDQYDEFRDNIGLMARRITPNKYEELKGQVKELKDRLARLERQVRTNTDALLKLEDRRMLGGE